MEKILFIVVVLPSVKFVVSQSMQSVVRNSAPMRSAFVIAGSANPITAAMSLRGEAERLAVR
jgi:hypothetical protein